MPAKQINQPLFFVYEYGKQTFFTSAANCVIGYHIAGYSNFAVYQKCKHFLYLLEFLHNRSNLSNLISLHPICHFLPVPCDERNTAAFLK